MITLHNTHGEPHYVSVSHVLYVKAALKSPGDMSAAQTYVALTGGQHLMVLERADEVVKKIEDEQLDIARLTGSGLPR